MAKGKYMGSPVHRVIDDKRFYCIAWYPKKSEAVERAEDFRKRRIATRVIHGAPWGYPRDKVYMVYVSDHTGGR